MIPSKHWSVLELLMCTSNRDPRDSPAPASSIKGKLLTAHSISHQCVQGATTWGSRAGLPFLSQGRWDMNSNVQQQNQLSYTSGKQRSKASTTSLLLQTPLSLNDIVTIKQPGGIDKGRTSVILPSFHSFSLKINNSSIQVSHTDYLTLVRHFPLQY